MLAAAHENIYFVVPFYALLLTLAMQSISVFLLCLSFQAEVTEAVSHISLSAPSPVLPTVSSEERKERWEQGQADYMGVDSFDNIKKKLDTYLQ